MARYTVEAPDGRRVTIEGDSQPTEADLEEVFSSLPNKDAPASDPTLPNSAQVDNAVSGREDLLSQVMANAGNNAKLVANPLETGKNALGLLGGVAQRAEAAIANPAGDMQKGNFQPQTLLDSVVNGLRGKVLGQFGDLVRRTGVAGDYNEALASTTGFMAALSIPDLLTKGKVSQGIDKAGKGLISGTDQAVKDAVTNKTGFLQDVRSAFYDAKSAASEKYGAGLEEMANNPNNAGTVVNLRPVVDQLNAEIAYEPKLRNAIGKVPQLSSILDNPQVAEKMGIKEAQQIVNDLQSKISSGKLKGIGVRPDDIPLLDAVHDIKSQMVQAFPDLAELRKDYGDILNRFNMVRNKLKPGNLSKAVKDNFGDVEVEDAAKKLLKDAPEILARMKNYNLLRKAGKAALLGAEGVSGALLLKKVINS